MSMHSRPTVFFSILRMIIGAVLCAAPSLFADPTLSSSKSVNQDLLEVSISGKELPKLQSISLTCCFDLQRIALLNAIVSSPLPSTAFSALIDTAASSLMLSLHATTTIEISDGTALVQLKIPITVNQETETAFTLLSAEYTDPEGNSHSVAIDPTGGNSIHSPPHSFRLPPDNAPRSTCFQLNGRRFRGRIDNRASRGYFIQRRGHSSAIGRITVR